MPSDTASASAESLSQIWYCGCDVDCGYSCEQEPTPTVHGGPDVHPRTALRVALADDELDDDVPFFRCGR